MIEVQKEKIIGKFEIVEPKLFILNEGKLRLNQTNLDAFEICRKVYITIKAKFDALIESDQAQEVPKVENMWTYKILIEN